ncbi:MAG: hypothetical protein KC457_31730 [Myxococcales bacterium]|nr:hypothetical protein [Myxococcales bacterium]
MSLARRPLLVVEDHLHHLDRLLELLRRRAPALLERLSVVCLDRPGPDTQAAVLRWAQEMPQVQVLADAEPALPTQRALPRELQSSANAYAKTLVSLLAPRGLLVQDIQLETLRFIGPDRWWETIYLANTVRGMYAERPPACVFLSNKRGFNATFGRELLSVGFDPRDVLHKDEIDEALLPVLTDYFESNFPLRLQVSGEPGVSWLTRDQAEVDELNGRLDLVLWEDRAAKLVLSGRALKGKSRRELTLGSHEALTWRALVEARIDGEVGVPIREVGERVAPDLALPAEQSNAAAKHIYALRTRLKQPEGLVTFEHHYALADELGVGWVRPG